jgi:hypothetical protein
MIPTTTVFDPLEDRLADYRRILFTGDELSKERRELYAQVVAELEEEIRTRDKESS